MASKKTEKKISSFKDAKTNEQEVIIPWQEAMGIDENISIDADANLQHLDIDDNYESYEDREDRYAQDSIYSYPIGLGKHAAELHFDASNHFMKEYVKTPEKPGISLMYFTEHYDMHSKFWKAPVSSELVMYTIENEIIRIPTVSLFNDMFPSLAIFEEFCEDKGVVHWTKHYCFDDFVCKFNYDKACYVRVSGNTDTAELFVNAVTNNAIENQKTGFAYNFRNSYYNYLHANGKYDLRNNTSFFPMLVWEKVNLCDAFYDKLAEMYMKEMVFNQFLESIDGGKITFPENGGLKFCELTAKELAATNPSDNIFDTYYKLTVLHQKENNFRREHNLPEI